MSFESLPPVFCSGLSTFVSEFKYYPFLKFKLLRVAILKRKVTIFRANSCALETSKF